MHPYLIACNNVAEKCRTCLQMSLQMCQEVPSAMLSFQKSADGAPITTLCGTATHCECDEHPQQKFWRCWKLNSHTAVFLYLIFNKYNILSVQKDASLPQHCWSDNDVPPVANFKYHFKTLQTSSLVVHKLCQLMVDFCGHKVFCPLKSNLSTQFLIRQVLKMHHYCKLNVTLKVCFRSALPLPAGQIWCTLH
jgi:hypothetical protein